MKTASASVLAFLSALLLALVLSGCGEAGCGDGLLQEGETCDDGNLDDGDGCGGDCQLEFPGGLGQRARIDAYVRGLDPVPAAPASEVVNSETGAKLSPDGIYSCSAQNLTQTVPVTEISILADGTADLFPGALLNGDSLYTGQFAQAAFKRQPLTYSLSLQDGKSGRRSATMQNPTLSEFRDSFGALLEQAQLDKVPVSAQAQIQEVRSQEELAFSLGINVDTPKFDVAGAFDFTNQKLRSRFLVTVDMAFFTADLDPITNPSDILDESVTLAEVQGKLSGANPPVYVSSITYGTRIYFAVESEFSAEEVQASLDAAFQGTVVKADGELTLSTKDVFQNSTVRFVAVGASQAQLAKIGQAIQAQNKLQAFQDFLADPAVFSATNLGLPLSFTMKHLADNSLAALSFRGTFDVQSCTRVGQDIQVTLKSIAAQNVSDGFGDKTLELFGNIVAQSLAGNQVLETEALLALDANQALSVSEDKAFVASGAQFQKILRIHPQVNPKVRLSPSLIERDALGADDPIPPQTLELNKDSEVQVGGTTFRGFNGEHTLFVPYQGGDLTLTFAFKPVP